VVHSKVAEAAAVPAELVVLEVTVVPEVKAVKEDIQVLVLLCTFILPNIKGSNMLPQLVIYPIHLTILARHTMGIRSEQATTILNG
tara:strand:- start:245 stop:502 length:258 start_codon:yes stop_codon:yes gene_type:complete